ncbi:hypothetical protein ACHAW6_003386 [Cyclotella cf. meneghiniana]
MRSLPDGCGVAQTRLYIIILASIASIALIVIFQWQPVEVACGRRTDRVAFNQTKNQVALLQDRLQELEQLLNSSEIHKAYLRGELNDLKNISEATEMLLNNRVQELESEISSLNTKIAEIESSDEIRSLGYLPPNGEWIKDPNKTFAAPICCGWDGRQYLANPEACGTTSLNEYEVVGRKDFLAQSGGNGCSCSARGFRDEYTWTGIEKAWNATEACNKLDGRKVLMIGDSTMGQTSATLMNALFPAGCQTQFTYSVCDTLVHKSMGNLDRGKKWTDLVIKYHPDIVILSAGPHIYNRSNFDIVVNSVIEGSKSLKIANPHLEVVWKTQQPAGCTANITKEIMLDHDYQYDEFYERDLYALSIFPRHGIHLIDMRMLYFRSDAHVGGKDCIHMCIPGPLDIIAPLFSELLDNL